LARGQRLAGENKIDDAITHLTTLATKFDVAEVYRDLGRSAMKKGDAVKAVEFLKKAAEKTTGRPDSLKANVYMWLGRALAKGDAHGEAKEAYAQALAATSEVSSTYYFLGVTLMALQEGPAARDALSRYLAAEPSGANASDAKERLSQL
jgi:tetratricopeptide (TPR) repeat protein